MNINIKKILAGFFILLAVNARADTPGIPAQGEHSKRIYIAPDGKRYIARDLPLYLYISSTPGGENVVPLAPKAPNDLSPSSPQPLQPEGLQVFKRTNPDSTKDPGYEIYIDGTSPVTTATFPGAPIYEKDGKIYYGKGLTVELVSRDLLSGVQETYLSINGKPYAPQTGSFSDFPADSFVHLRYYAVDQVGNVEKPVETMFYLDVSPPDSELQVKGNYDNNILAPGSVLELSAEDALSGVKEIHYKWDQGPERVYTGAFDPTELSEGDHTLNYYAIDQTGNIEEIKTGVFFYDKTAPAVTVSMVGDRSDQGDRRDQAEREGMVFVSRAARTAMAARDNHAGTAAIRYSVDAGEEQTYQEPFPLPLPAGLHRITYRAVDKVGNWSEPQTWSVYLDMTPPDTQYQISGYYAGSQTDIVLRKDVPVYLVSTDLEAGVKEIRCRIDNGETFLYKDLLKFETNGVHTLAYWGVDGANNREEEKKLELRVDNSLKGTGGQDSGRYPRQWYVDQTSQLTGTVDIPFYLLLSTSDKNDGQWFLLDLPKLGADTGQSIMFKKGGIDYLQLKAGEDRADIFQVRIDALPPLTRAVFSGAKIYEGRDGIYFGPGLTAAVDARDAEDKPKGIVSGYRETYVSLDDSPFFTYKAPLSVFSREKAYRFRYFSVDNVGNAEEVKENKFTVDTTPPVTTWKVSGLTQGRILSPQSLIELSAVDNLTGVKEIYYRFDDGPEKKYSGILSKAELGRLAMGEHILYFYAQDQTGNREKTGELSFYLDIAGHTLELKINGDRYDKGEVVYISPRSRLGFTAGSAAGDQTPVKNIRYRFDGGAETGYENTTFQPPQANGRDGASARYVLTYSGSDAVGNTGKTQTRVIFVDAEPPQTHLKLDGPVYRDRYSTFAVSRTLIELSAVDEHTGIKAIYYRVDGSPAKEYRGPFSVQAGGKHTLTYYAVDMVNNSEKPLQMAFQIDNEPPALQINYNVEPLKDSGDGVPVYPRDLVIGFNAVDSQTEVDKIIYRFNNGKELLYRNLVSDFEPGKVYRLTVYALDRLGNKREQSVVFRVE